MATYSLQTTILGRRLDKKDLSPINKILRSYGASQPTYQSSRCVRQTILCEGHRIKPLRQLLADTSNLMETDILLQEQHQYQTDYKMVCFDMDSTLIKTEVIDELAKFAGVGDKVRAITASAMRGEIDFRESFQRRMALLEGLSQSVLAEISDSLPLMDGLEVLIKNLKKYDYKLAILSGGFSYFAEELQVRLGFDYVYANKLEIISKKLTGQAIEPIIDSAKKAELLYKLAAQEDLSTDQIVAVGDGANDLAMLNTAGLGIAFHAKPIVREKINHAISWSTLESLLYLLKFNDSDITR